MLFQFRCRETEDWPLGGVHIFDVTRVFMISCSLLYVGSAVVPCSVRVGRFCAYDGSEAQLGSAYDICRKLQHKDTYLYSIHSFFHKKTFFLAIVLRDFATLGHGTIPLTIHHVC